MSELGTLTLPKMSGRLFRDGMVELIGEPWAVAGTDKLRCLANMQGKLAVVELSIRFELHAPPPIAKDA